MLQENWRVLYKRNSHKISGMNSSKKPLKAIPTQKKRKKKDWFVNLKAFKISKTTNDQQSQLMLSVIFLAKYCQKIKKFQSYKKDSTSIQDTPKEMSSLRLQPLMKPSMKMIRSHKEKKQLLTFLDPKWGQKWPQNKKFGNNFKTFD